MPVRKPSFTTPWSSDHCAHTRPTPDCRLLTLRIRRRQPQTAPVGAHLVLLVGANAQIGARLARAQQDKARFPVLRKISIGIRLVHLARAFQTPGTSQAATLVA